MHKYKLQPSGFSLIELMITMSLSLILILGISTIFVSVKKTFTYSQQLENTQEVLRFTSSIFSRAIHSANEMGGTDKVVGTSDTYKQLDLTFNLDNLDTAETYESCLGNAMSSKFYESYRLTGNDLYCTDYTTTMLNESTDPFTPIGTNIDELSFTINGNLLTVTIKPTDEADAIEMIFAQRQAILGLN